MPINKSKFIIIDAYALIHRAWHALPPLTTKQGELVNAVYGFSSILLNVIKELKPTHIAVAFDCKEKTFRHKEFKEYKAQRVKQPDEFYQQIPLIKKIITALNIKTYEKAGYEADDLIGAFCHRLDPDKNTETIIVTGDLDTLQLVDDNTKVFTLKRGLSDTIIYDEDKVKERLGGLSPKQVVDYKALRGDPSDNIPGVKGIGEKTAIILLTEFGTLEKIYQYLEKNSSSEKIKDKTKNLLLKYKQDAFQSQKLATLATDVEFDFSLEQCYWENFDREKVAKLFQRFEFKSLLSKIPQTNATTITEEIITKKENDQYHLITNDKEFIEFFKKLSEQKTFALDTETTGLDPRQAKLLGISFAWQSGEAWFIYQPTKQQLKKLKPILENEKINKFGHNIKYDLEILQNVGINLSGIIFDTMLASYLINPGSRAHSLDSIAFTELGIEATPITQLIGKGKNQLPMQSVNPQELSQYACEDADYTLRLVKKLKPQLQEKNILGLFTKIEIPLIPVLATIETNGLKINPTVLNKLSKIVTKEIKELENKIHNLTESDFNINSPKQLKEVLFEQLAIPCMGIKKTKTGISTAAGELEKLKNQHPIIPFILEYRELTKLKNTYIDTLPSLINPQTKRLHTSFNQTITATGRLSSSNPNLQNIPIRNEWGTKIRQAFIAESGYELLSIDYSQIELRVIASLAQDKKMIEAFKQDKDIHTRTAAEIYNIKPDEVTISQRRQAKTVNFGIIYGMGAFGLAERVNISRVEAQEFIDKYFSLHQELKQYIDQMKKMAQDKGYVETLFGRRRYLPEINSRIFPVRNTAERMAINMPVQGTAADLMKLAMIEVDKEINKTFKPSEVKMILQIHDSLIFEVKKDLIKQATKIIQDKMENVCKLRVSIKVHIESGTNWGDLTPLTKNI